MTDLSPEPPKRKVLSLKKEKHPQGLAVTPPRYLREALSVYMVWCPDGEMPKRVYQSDEQTIATSHAKRLAHETGRRFYVMRSWRGFDPSDG